MQFTDYDTLTDEELLKLAGTNDQTAVDCLMERYKYLVRQKAHALFLIGGEEDDLIQEGMIGLYKAMRDYIPDHNASFYSFAGLCISRQIYTAIKTSNRKKNFPLNTYISFYTPISVGTIKQGDETESLVDVLFPGNDLNPEDMIIDKENTKRLQEEIDICLSSFEKQVAELFIRGMKYTEIAKKMDKEVKSIDNALQRIRIKVNRILAQLEEE